MNVLASPSGRSPAERRWRATLLAAVVTVTAAGCGGSTSDGSRGATTEAKQKVTTTAPTSSAPTEPRPASSTPSDGGSGSASPLPGMPRVTDRRNLYGAAGAGRLAPGTAGALPRVYVPNGMSGTVTVIDQASKRPVASFRAGRLPQHIVPSYDLKTLWVLDNEGNALIPIDPTTSKPGAAVPVDDPYNMYFTPDGSEAIVVAEERQRLDFRDPHTMALHSSLQLPCNGLNHIDFSADGRTLLATCEFAGQMVEVDLVRRTFVKVITLGDGTGMPQDVRISPDGAAFFVADMAAGGVWVIDGAKTEVVGFIPTGTGAHGLYPSRDGTKLYVSNRGSPSLSQVRAHGPGSISVIDFASRQVVANWPIPRGGSPDMGNLSVDGSELWLSGRYDSEVYVFDTTSGALKDRIAVGRGPHGLTVWPQPGRYSLGHTGNMR